MEVAKYIGLFLLKNQACYIHGLGNLELKRKPATFNGDTLQAGTYEVLLTASGSIDDNLANFIATNELISISKASNALREFSEQSKADLEAGKDVLIPAIGRFAVIDGKMKFITDKHMQYAPPPIPAMRSSRRMEEEMAIPHTHHNEAPKREYSAQPQYSNVPRPKKGGILSQLNWGRILLALFLLGILGVGAVYTFRYMKNRKGASNNAIIQAPETDTAVAPAPADSAALKVDSTAVDTTGTIEMVDGKLHYQVIIDNFTTRKKADKKAKLMRSYGHEADVIAEDSFNFDVVMPVIALPADTAHIMDSMRRYYNPAGVYIY